MTDLRDLHKIAEPLVNTYWSSGNVIPAAIKDFKKTLSNLPFENIDPERQLTRQMGSMQDRQMLGEVTEAMTIVLRQQVTGANPKEKTINDEEKIDLMLKAMVYFTKEPSEDKELFQLISQPTITFPEDYLDNKDNSEINKLAQSACLTNQSATKQLAQRLTPHQCDTLKRDVTKKLSNLRTFQAQYNSDNRFGSTEQLAILKSIDKS